jgi:hypothetical protein
LLLPGVSLSRVLPDKILSTAFLGRPSTVLVSWLIVAGRAVRIPEIDWPKRYGVRKEKERLTAASLNKYLWVLDCSGK